MESSRLKKLRSLVDEFKTVAEFARTYDLDVSYIRQLLSGHRTFGEKASRKMGSQICGDPLLFEGGIEDGPAVRGWAPVISWVQAGAWNHVSDPLQPGDAEEWLPCPTKHGQRTYALRVRGDSMTAPYGRSYPDGCIIFVDPDQKAPANGARIIAKLAGSDEVTFKVFVQESGKTWLRPLNPHHPAIHDEFRVLGTVISTWIEE